MITTDEIARLRELEKKATPGPWKLKMEKIDMGRKEFPMIIGGFHVVCTIGAFEWDSNKDERDANTKLITVFRNALPNLLDEIERLKKVLNQTDLELDMARRDRNKAEAERDATKAILSDPEAVHTNIMLGRIALPDYYVQTTDTNGPFAKLTADLAAALKRAEVAEEDAERLDDALISTQDDRFYCLYCGEWMYTWETKKAINHSNDCPASLHRQLVKDKGGEG